MNWAGCEFVGRIPGKCSGEPTIRGTRISPDSVLEYAARGASVEEILDDFPLSRRLSFTRFLYSPVQNAGSSPREGIT